MSKNLKMSLLISLVAVISFFVGGFIGVIWFKDAFIVCQLQDSVAAYRIRHGKIAGSTGMVYPVDSNNGQKHEVVEINLEDVHTNEQAIKRIEEQLEAIGGHVIAVHN